MRFEYKTIGAPERGRRQRGAKTRSDRAAVAFADLLSAEAVDGWEYQRTDTIPVEERSGLFGRTQHAQRAVMVFRRALEEDVTDIEGAAVQPDDMKPEILTGSPIADIAPAPLPERERPTPSVPLPPAMPSMPVGEATDSTGVEPPLEPQSKPQPEPRVASPAGSQPR